MNKNDKKKVEALQEIERITQMQFDNQIYIEGGHSIYPNSKTDDNYTDLFFTGSYTDFNELDKTLDIDLNECDLGEVILTLVANRLLQQKYVKALTGNSWNLDILFN